MMKRIPEQLVAAIPALTANKAGLARVFRSSLLACLLLLANGGLRLF